MLVTVVCSLLSLVSLTTASAQQAAPARKPNIVVIFGDDIGVWNISAYHRGMMGGRTPNIDRLAQQGAMFCVAISLPGTLTAGTWSCPCNGP
jgi:hypothetical protein